MFFLPQEFEEERDADDAVYEMNGRELLGERWDLINFFVQHFGCDEFIWYFCLVLMFGYMAVLKGSFKVVSQPNHYPT